MRPALRLAAVASCLALTACVTAPKPLQGEWGALTPQAAGDADVGTGVRWGGRIVDVLPAEDRTCFDLIAQPLAANGSPDGSDISRGRFRACRAGFYDPAIFQPNREVTFTGRIEGFNSVRVGEFSYRQPRVAADVVFLWPERRDVDVVVERVWW